MRDLQRFFEEFNREFDRAMEQARMGRQTHGIREAEGYRKEVVDGEVTEYYLEDGEWKEIGAEKEGTYEVGDNSFTIDLSGEVAGTKAVASASFNNGVLSVEFAPEEQDGDSTA